MLYFAYGSNMHRAIMRKHAPNAEPVGAAALTNYRFIVTADGYASVAPAAGENVHGLVWRLTPPDRVTLDAWENVAGGLYRAETLPIEQSGKLSPALVYIARQCPIGRPRRGYMEFVIGAARMLELPADYISSLQGWLPKDAADTAGLPRFGEFG
ncbi:MAG: gamma-glutamylcyclotransferase family protein [Xanthobacteraceae bacterium]